MRDDCVTVDSMVVPCVSDYTRDGATMQVRVALLAGITGWIVLHRLATTADEKEKATSGSLLNNLAMEQTL